MLLRARWIFSGDRAPLAHGVIEIGNGQVQRVDSARGDEGLDLGDVAIIPGLINAHTHLEFSRLPQPLQPLNDFPEWIRTVISQRQQDAGDRREAILAGLEESALSGVTGVGEVATADPPEHIPAGAARQLVFREILGLNPARVEDQLAVAKTFLSTQESSETIERGLSPHAPYSLHPDLFNGLCQLAKRHQTTVAMHLAESPAELQLLRSGDGPLVEMLQSLGVWPAHGLPIRRSPMDFLEQLAELPRVLVVHGNFLTEEELTFIAARLHLSVVYCPRTHAAMQQGDHSWRRMQALGINVALGTDSRASNPDLSLWNELRFLHHRHADIPVVELLKLGTVNGAQALGWNDTGRLRSGARADLCVVRLPAEGTNDPERLFDGEIIGVMQAGTWRVPVTP